MIAYKLNYNVTMFSTIGLFLLFVVQYDHVVSLTDISYHSFGLDKNGVIAAFGDFDGDRTIDIFALTDEGNSLLLLLGHADLTDGHFTRHVLIDAKQFPGTVITAVVPADFDGDSQMDILVTRKHKGQTSTQITVHIYWGNGISSVQALPLTLNETLRDQPAVIDANGDMIPDLFGEVIIETKPQRSFWIFTKNRNYTLTPIVNETHQELSLLRIPQSSAFLDLNGDLTSDLCAVSVSSSNQLQFEFWYNVNGVLTWNKTIPGPEGVKFPGQPSYTDMEGNLSVDIVLPACVDEACTSSRIYVWSQSKWYNLSLELEENHVKWNFVPPSRTPRSWLASSHGQLRMGDFNLNSFPDALTVLYSNTGGNVTYGAFVMNNADCGSRCEGFPRTYHVDLKHPVLPASNKYPVPAFFDFLENGILDVVVSLLNSTHSEVRALKQTFTADACFEKITVVSGLCWDNCPHQPFGVNQIGPSVKIHTTKPNGDPQISIASQLTQSAYFSLQLPFILFGLGQTPNFVDTLDVGIPYPIGKKPRHKRWTSIIPNAQLIIVPHPLDHPHSWKNKLFATPSRLVLLTGSALLGTCGFIAAIIGILHWRERVEDKKEKLEEAQRFHFDAM